nr:restriction endonuclease fold toxin [Paenibacillus curdlanolyticus]
MSSINVNLTELIGIKRSLEKSQSRLTKAANGAASVRIDGAISARRSIGSRVASVNRSIQDVEYQMNQLIAFLGDAIQRYEHNEGEIDKLLSEIQDFREKRSAWDWIVDQAEYVGDKMKDAWNSIDDFIQDTLDLIQAYTSAMCEFIDQAMAAVNQGLDYLRDMAIASGKISIEQYFLYGVLKGLVDTIGGVLKLVIELPLIIPQIVLTIEGYAIDVFMNEDPFEKIKDDILSLPDKAEAMLSNIKEAFIEIKTEFMNADANHKAEMIGFAVEKVLEIAIPGLKGLSLAKDIGLGAKTLSAFTRGGRSLFEGLSDNLITQAFKNSMEKLLDMEIRGFGDALAPVGMDGFIPSGTTIREIFENLGLIRKSDAPELDGRMPEGTGDAASRLISGKGIYTQYSGGLRQAAKEDAGADLLAKKLGGQSRMIFNNDPKGREFDVISDQYIGQTKTSMNSLSSQFREQAKATIEAAIETGRQAYFHFETAPADKVIRQLREYEKRYNVEIVIDISPF